MGFTISTRRLTPGDCERLRAIGKVSFDERFWVFILPAFGLGSAGYFAGRLIEWLLSLAAFQVAPYLRIGLSVAGGLGGVWETFVIYPSFKRSKLAPETDLRNDTVEVISVSDARVIEQQECNDEGPILYFEVDANRILFLMGQWLYDTENFPSTEFTVHRAPVTGDVLKLEVRGTQLSPLKKLEWDEVLWLGFRESELFDGNFENLQAAVKSKLAQLEAAEHTS
jgi:hypothetical protein